MSQTIAPKENKMGTMPVNRLLITMSLPMIISMIIQALYNIVDSVFVSKINENALTAVSLAFPIQNLMIAVAVGTAVGVNALLSRSLGEKKQKEANLAANNGIFLSILSFAAFAVFGIFFSRYFFEAQFSAADLLKDPAGCAQIIEYGTDYLFICTVFSFGIFLQITMERLMQSTGKTIYNMITQGTGAVINIILDPILIFGWFGLPAFGVKGAAIATVIGQIAGMLLNIYFNVKKNHEVKLDIKQFRPHLKTIKTIYAVGLPSIIVQSVGSVMMLGMNKILLLFSSTAVSAFGIYFKLQSFVFMPVFGLTNGMVPIVAFNYGARNKKRITDTIRLSIYIAIGIMLAGFILFQFFPSQLLSMFHATEELMVIGVPALRIISTSFLFAGFSIIASCVFQALGNGIYSMIISIARQLFLILPTAYLFAKLFNLDTVWMSFPIAEIVSAVLSAFFLKRIFKTTLSKI